MVLPVTLVVVSVPDAVVSWDAESAVITNVSSIDGVVQCDVVTEVVDVVAVGPTGVSVATITGVARVARATELDTVVDGLHLVVDACLREVVVVAETNIGVVVAIIVLVEVVAVIVVVIGMVEDAIFAGSSLDTGFAISVSSKHDNNDKLSREGVSSSPHITDALLFVMPLLLTTTAGDDPD